MRPQELSYACREQDGPHASWICKRGVTEQHHNQCLLSVKETHKEDFVSLESSCTCARENHGWLSANCLRTQKR